METEKIATLAEITKKIQINKCLKEIEKQICTNIYEAIRWQWVEGSIQ